MPDRREGSVPSNPSQFEEEILDKCKDISQAKVGELLREEESQSPIKSVRLPEMPCAMENKVKRGKVVETRLGTLHMQHNYYFDFYTYVSD